MCLSTFLPDSAHAHSGSLWHELCHQMDGVWCLVRQSITILEELQADESPCWAPGAEGLVYRWPGCSLRRNGQLECGRRYAVIMLQ